MASMLEADVPGTDSDIELGDPSTYSNVLSLILGAAVLFMTFAIGSQLSDRINSFLSELLGISVGGGNPGGTRGGGF